MSGWLDAVRDSDEALGGGVGEVGRKSENVRRVGRGDCLSFGGGHAHPGGECIAGDGEVAGGDAAAGEGLPQGFNGAVVEGNDGAYLENLADRCKGVGGSVGNVQVCGPA